MLVKLIPFLGKHLLSLTAAWRNCKAGTLAVGVKGYEDEGCCSGFEGRDPRLMELSAHSGTYTCISQYRAGIRKSQRHEKIPQADFTNIRPVYQAADSPLSLTRHWSPSSSSQPVFLQFFLFTAQGDNPIPRHSDRPVMGLPGLPARMQAVLMQRLHALQMKDRD